MWRNAPQHVAAAANSPFSFSFDFSTISASRLVDLRLEGDAALRGKLVDLTCNSLTQRIANNNCMGRMAYAHPVPFYDSITGEVSSFTTRFTFAIGLNASGGHKGGGMAFFLSSYPSRLPSGSSGGNLGLSTEDGQSQAYGTNQFIAVEFDTLSNPWDPRGTQDHIGIDINSVRQSVNTTSLPTFSLNGSMTACITFDSSTKMLVASLQFDGRPSAGPVEVSTMLPDLVTSLLPSEVAVGFSASTGKSFQLHQILSWSFDSTLATRAGIGALQAQIKLSRVTNGSVTNNGSMTNNGSIPDSGPVPDSRPVPDSGSVDNRGSVVNRRSGATSGSGSGTNIGAIIGSVAGLSVAGVLWCIMSECRWRRTRDSFASGTSGLRRFEYRDLARGTGEFSQDSNIGEGAFGQVYKGSCRSESGRLDKVAVKRIKETTGEVKDFIAELHTISETRHGNLVKLKGWCCSPNRWDFTGFLCWCRRQKVKLFLVYELVPNGNLDNHLHLRKEILPWEKRYKIVKGIGSALNYLHHGCRPPILHRDIKPKNILLDDEFNAKLADFGLSRITGDNSTTLVTTATGTLEYMDPQLRRNGQVKFNCRSDVYSFGIVLLEIACGKKPREQIQLEELRSSRAQAQSFVEVVADDKLNGDFNRTQMHRVVFLGLRCSDPVGERRPYMQDAMKYLEDGIELPVVNRSEGGHHGASDTFSTDEQALMPPGARSSS